MVMKVLDQERDLPELIDLIYDAAVDPTQWPRFLDRLCDMAPGAKSVMMMHDASTRSINCRAARPGMFQSTMINCGGRSAMTPAAAAPSVMASTRKPACFANTHTCAYVAIGSSSTNSCFMTLTITSDMASMHMEARRRPIS